MQFDEVLRTWKAFFEREGVRYALIGGLAMRAWGSSRTTEDVDFVVDLSARDRVVAFAEAEGFETLHVSDSYSNRVPGVDRAFIRDYFARKGMLDVFDEIEKRA